MTTDVDLAVIGGGPAGGAAVLEAARLTMRVAWFDPVDPAADRPCGEGIMPGGVDVLERLGLRDLVSGGRRFSGIRHFVPGARPLETRLPRPGVAIRRPALGSALARVASRSPHVRLVRAPAEATRVAGGFTIRATGGEDFVARTVIAADGSLGNALPWLRSSRAHPRAPARFGLRARFEERVPIDVVEVHMGNGCEVYLTPLPGGEVNAAVLFERVPDGVAGPESLLRLALERHPEAARHLGALTTPPTGRPLVRRTPRMRAEDGAFLAGDAGGSVDPILGCGVAIALESGVLSARAARAILDGGDVRALSRRYATAFRRLSTARHLLATTLRQGDAHPRLARAVVTLLHRVPQAPRALARIAGGR